MKKFSIPKYHKVDEMASEYRFDYSIAKTNHFAEGMRLGWTVEMFMEEEKKEKPKASSPKGKPVKAKKPASKKSVTKTKPAKKKKK